MCGINGLIALKGTELEDPHRLVSEMNRSIAHRGPDDSGIWVSANGSVVLGHQRLSILDLSENGHQPMRLGAGAAIVFNGEIYNHRELRKLTPNFQYRSESDTETLLALYESMGPSCLEHLVGMFAFALWDPDRRRLVMARDRIGKKPLYYSIESGIFAFSSEIRALLTLPWIQRRVNEKALYYFLTFGFTPPPYTMFKGIEKLDTGCSMHVEEDGSMHRETYWSVDFQDFRDDEAAAGDELLSSIRRSVGLRMVSDVPVGLFLSGGVDSSAIAAMMRDRTDEPIHTFSISFADQPDYDESASARAMAARYGCVHHERVVTAEDLRTMIPLVVDAFDDPLADATCVPIYFLAEMARAEGIKVVMTGDGPDELLLGYRNWRRYIRLYPHYQKFIRIPGFARRLAYRLGKACGLSAVAQEMLHRAMLGQELFWGSAPSFKESVKRDLLSTGFGERSRGWDCHDEIARLRKEYDADANPASRSDANWMAYLGLRFVIPNFYLHRADRLGMRHSIEIRTPYLDHRLVSLCLSLPDKWKVKHGVPKYLMKKVLEPVLPAETLYAAKRGFCVPLAEWGGETMTRALDERIGPLCRDTGLFNEPELRRQVHAGNSNDLWNLYFLVNWFDRWMPSA